MTKQVCNNYKKYRWLWFGGGICLAVISVVLIGFLFANKAVDEYTKSYILWQKDTATQFITKTSPEVNQVVFLSNFETQEIVDEQKKVCSELKTVVETIDKGTDQPPRLGFVPFGFLNPSYNRTKVIDKERQALLEKYLKTARRVYEQARIDCEFDYQLNVIYIELKPKFEELKRIGMSYGESRNGLTCQASYCVPTTLEEIAQYLEAYTQSYIAKSEKYLSYWKSQDCLQTSYQKMCNKEAERYEIILEADRAYVEEVKAASSPSDDRIHLAHIKTVSEYERANKLQQEAGRSEYGDIYEKELNSNEALSVRVMRYVLKTGFEEARTEAKVFSEN